MVAILTLVGIIQTNTTELNANWWSNFARYVKSGSWQTETHTAYSDIYCSLLSTKIVKFCVDYYGSFMILS
jgi:hypothetical protein